MNYNTNRTNKKEIQIPAELEELIKTKSTNLRDLLHEVFNSDSESDLSIIDLAVVRDPLRIRIRDYLIFVLC